MAQLSHAPKHRYDIEVLYKKYHKYKICTRTHALHTARMQRFNNATTMSGDHQHASCPALVERENQNENSIFFFSFSLRLMNEPGVTDAAEEAER